MAPCCDLYHFMGCSILKNTEPVSEFFIDCVIHPNPWGLFLLISVKSVYVWRLHQASICRNASSVLYISPFRKHYHLFLAWCLSLRSILCKPYLTFDSCLQRVKPHNKWIWSLKLIEMLRPEGWSVTLLGFDFYCLCCCLKNAEHVSLKDKRIAYHRRSLLTWMSKPAGHAIQLHAPITTRRDIFFHVLLAISSLPQPFIKLSLFLYIL